MKELAYWCMKLRYRLHGKNKEIISDYFRKMGMHIGPGCNICDNITTTEGCLITLGKNVTLAGGVLFVTHDNSISKMIQDTTDIFGKINIGDNCFIGNRALIMYGVTLANDITVAAGSVVTKSFSKSRVIIGGNPAKIIGTYDSFVKRNKDKAFNLNMIEPDQLINSIQNSPKLISRRCIDE